MVEDLVLALPDFQDNPVPDLPFSLNAVLDRDEKAFVLEFQIKSLMRQQLLLLIG